MRYLLNSLAAMMPGRCTMRGETRPQLHPDLPWSQALPMSFLIRDPQNRKIGYENGAPVNEIPGGSLDVLENGYFLSLPADVSYTLTTVGNGSITNTLSVAFPVSGMDVRGIAYPDFSIPISTTATTAFGKDTLVWQFASTVRRRSARSSMSKWMSLSNRTCPPC